VKRPGVKRAGVNGPGGHGGSAVKRPGVNGAGVTSGGGGGGGGVATRGDEGHRAERRLQLKSRGLRLRTRAEPSKE